MSGSEARPAIAMIGSLFRWIGPLLLAFAPDVAFAVTGFPHVAGTDTVPPPIKVTGFVDVYYAYDFGHSRDDERPRFLYQYDRHSEVDLNLGLVKLDYEKDKVRAALGLMAGTYAQANLINEPELLRNVYEAHVGMKLSRTKDLWLDAGIFSSHIGLESAIGIDNWTLTRSIVAENSPYYLSGAKLTWKPNDRLELAGLFLNGWQRIRRVQNDIPCFGTQVLWTMKKNMKLDWSTFLGSDTPDSLGLFRVFNNIWWSCEGPKWGLQLGADAGVEESPLSDEWDSWAGALAIVRRKWNDQWSGVFRAEYYTDPRQVIVPTGTEHGLTTIGYSLGVDLKVMEDAFIRLEGRTFHGVDDIYESVHGPVQDNTSITVSMAARF
ncbi:MAG: porin [Flavobacteriales bacterium]|nr:porin [Flavobacteriales bacterium]